MKEMDDLIRAATQIVAADIEEREILEDDIPLSEWREKALRKNAERMADARHALCKAITGSRKLICKECGRYPRDWPRPVCTNCNQEHGGQANVLVGQL